MNTISKVVGKISKEQLSELIESHLAQTLKQEEYEIVECNAKALLHPNRFGIAFKLFFLHYRESNYDLARDIFLDHIRAFSFGSYKEPYSKKKGRGAYLRTFDKIIKSIQRSGFDPKRSILVLSRDKILINGSHRVASAIFTNKPVLCVVTELPSPQYDQSFFYQRYVPQKFMDSAVRILIRHLQNPTLRLSNKAPEDNDNFDKKSSYFRKVVRLNSLGLKRLEQLLKLIDNSPQLATRASSNLRSNRWEKVYVTLLNKKFLPNENLFESEKCYLVKNKSEVVELSSLLFDEDYLDALCSNEGEGIFKRVSQLISNKSVTDLEFPKLNKEEIKVPFYRRSHRVLNRIGQAITYFSFILLQVFKKSFSFLLKKIGLYELAFQFIHRR